MKAQANRPIGVFDSGIGGLNLVKALQKLLPGEDIIYFGDTAHFPYGEKSIDTIREYVRQISYWLVEEKHCKCLVIACNSASASILDVPDILPNCLTFDVITPLITHLSKHYHDCKLGLIGTRPTINSRAYQTRIQALANNIQLSCKATPLLASLIEEGFAEHELTLPILDAYLTQMKQDNIRGLILGCTHYPLLSQMLTRYFAKTTIIIDSTEAASHHIAKELNKHDLISLKSQGQVSCYLSAISEKTYGLIDDFLIQEFNLQLTIPIIEC